MVAAGAITRSAASPPPTCCRIAGAVANRTFTSTPASLRNSSTTAVTPGSTAPPLMTLSSPPKAGGRMRSDSLVGVDVAEKVAQTAAGAEVHFDALVIAIGTSPVSDVPGTVTYQGPPSNPDVHRALLAIDRGEVSRLAFAVPATCRWSRPLYELALMAASHLADMGAAPGAIDLIAFEREPLQVFGAGASRRLRAELELRARWLSTLGPEARGELVNTPIAHVEARFAAWREEAHAPAGAEARTAAD